MVFATRANASSTISNVEVVTGMTSKTPVFSGNHSNDWTIWEMKMLAHLMEKGLDACLDPTFETRLPNKESGPFDMTVEDDKNQKEAVDISSPYIVSFIVYYSLHACARFNPPALIVKVKVLLELLLESPSFVNCLNRTPLHIVAGTHANFSVMHLLVATYPMACAMLDTDGKTPLHLACESAYSLFMGDEGCERDPPSTDLISTMIKVCPPVVCWEDNDGKSALEYAILSGAPIEVVRLLQAVT